MATTLQKAYNASELSAVSRNLLQSASHTLTIRHISKRYADCQRQVLRGGPKPRGMHVFNEGMHAYTYR